jgi:hypothetical protein
MISEISLIHSHYQEINHPCLSEDSDNDLIKNIDISKLEWESVQEFCIHNRDYNIHIITIKEFLIAYSFATSLLGFMLILIYSWFNEYRRIKYLIDGSLHDFKLQENKLEIINKKNKNDDDEDDDETIDNSNSKKDSKKTDSKNNKNKKNIKDGISIYISRNNDNKTLGGSSEIISTGGNHEKPSIKNEK